MHKNKIKINEIVFWSSFTAKLALMVMGFVGAITVVLASSNVIIGMGISIASVIAYYTVDNFFGEKMEGYEKTSHIRPKLDTGVERIPHISVQDENTQILVAEMEQMEMRKYRRARKSEYKETNTLYFVRKSVLSEEGDTEQLEHKQFADSAV